LPLTGETTLINNAAAVRVLGATFSIEPILAFNANSGVATAVPYVTESTLIFPQDPTNPGVGQKRILPASKPLTWTSVPTDDFWHVFAAADDATAGDENSTLRTWQSCIVWYKGLNNNATNLACHLINVSVHVEYIAKLDSATGVNTLLAGLSSLNPPHNQVQITKHENVLRQANSDGAQPLALDEFVRTLGGSVMNGVKDVAVRGAQSIIKGFMGKAAEYVAGPMMASSMLSASSTRAIRSPALRQQTSSKARAVQRAAASRKKGRKQ
jgi:hypothetical protein